MQKLNWQERRVLLDEQRKWRKNLFPIMVKHKDGSGSLEDKALAVLNARISDLEKLAKARKRNSIMGLPIQFGMSKKEVAAKLELDNMNILNVTDPESDQAYRVRLFGENVPVIFKFMNTTFLPGNNNESRDGYANFLKTLKKDFPYGSSETAYNYFVVTNLYSINISGMENRDDFLVLNEELAKKYKLAYPQFPPMAGLLEENGKWNYIQDDRDIVVNSNEFFYENKDYYIAVAGGWGNVSGQFDVDFISKAYLDLHISSIKVLFQSLEHIKSYIDSLVLLPANSTINDLVYAVGDGKLTYVQKISHYYYLEREYSNDGLEVYIDIHFTPDNEAFAVTVYYLDSEFPGFEESLVANLARKYKKLEDTPDSVKHFIGHLSNADFDFESTDNYIHIGSTPHNHPRHELTIIAKKALPDYEKAYKKQQEIEARQLEEHLDEVRRDSEKF